MASAKDFARLTLINGITASILVRGDGQIIGQASEEIAAYAPLIARSGAGCDSLSSGMGGNRYLHLCLERESGLDILVFPLGQFYLGVLKDPDSERQEILNQVIFFLKHLK